MGQQLLASTNLHHIQCVLRAIHMYIVQYNPAHISQHITCSCDDILRMLSYNGHESGICGGIFSKLHLSVEVAPLSLLASISSRLKTPILQWLESRLGCGYIYTGCDIKK